MEEIIENLGSCPKKEYKTYMEDLRNGKMI